MSGIAPDGRESRQVLVCQGNNPEIICAKLFILLIGRTETSFTFYLASTLLEASSWWDPSPNSSPSISNRVNNFYTERKKDQPTSLHLLCMQPKKAGHLKLLLAQTSCCSHSTGRGRATEDFIVPLRKAFSGHIKDKSSHHSSEAGKGDSANQLSTPTDLLSPSPHVLNLQGIARSPGVQALHRSLLLLLRQLPVPHPPSSPRRKARHRIQLLHEESPDHTHFDRERKI